MSFKRFLLPTTALLLLLGAAFCLRQPGAAQEKVGNALTKWEYKYLYFRWGRTERADRPQLPMEKMEEIMNDLGGKGWELSGTISDVAGDTDQKLRVTANTNIILLFKRPKK
jgi:hypothetical protein